MAGENHLDNDTNYEDGISNSENTLSVPEADKPFTIYVTPDAGVASLEPSRQVLLPRYPRRKERLIATVKSSARGSRTRLTKHAVSNQLGACLVLTYRSFPVDHKADVDKYLKQIRRLYPHPFSWAVITEGKPFQGGTRIHHNVLLPASPYLAQIATCWPHGDVFIGINPTDSDIRRMVRYVSKDFNRLDGLSNRFRRSRGGSARTMRRQFKSRQDAVSEIENIIPEGATGVYVHDPKCAGRRIFYWNVNPHQM